MPPDSLSIIPKPNDITVIEGRFTLSPATRIHTLPEFRSKAEYLAKVLRRSTGYPFEIIEDPTVPKTNYDIALALPFDWQKIGTDGYAMRSSGNQAYTIHAPTATGIGHGIQTFLQLCPPAIYHDGPCAFISWDLPRVMIEEDSPRFAWRGVLLDCARHFMPKEFVKKFIDTMAMHKLNILHWHLTNDQGWRLEIKKYPKLTEIGSQRRESQFGHLYALGGTGAGVDGIPHGGFYTQEDAREIVAYAAERNITVVPEIGMPGHAQAAIASYPELGCTSEKLEVSGLWEGNHQVFNPYETTMRFLEDVLSEVLDIFPSPSIHIGGDEANKKQWEASPEIQARRVEVGAKDSDELQSWFIRRIAEFLAKHGRRLVGWDEILEGGIAPSAVVMSWHGTAGGIAAAKAEHETVMTPWTHTYFDHYQTKDSHQEPVAIGGCLPLEKVYQFEPVPAELNEEEAKYVIGLQGQLWSEYMQTPGKVEYMAFPRVTALAEVGWSTPGSRDFDCFKARLTRHFQRLNVMGVHYRPLS